MKTRLFLVVITQLVILNFRVSVAGIRQNPPIHFANEDYGIPVTQHVFDRMVEQKITIMRRNSHVTIKDLITMVRIDNTITMSPFVEKKQANEYFQSLFANKYANLFIKKLHARENRGLSYYSKKYNLYWGGLDIKIVCLKLLKLLNRW